MDRINITPAIKKIKEIVDSHRLSDGVYCRFSEIREPNPYGTADAANILYSIGSFPRCPRERGEWVKSLRSMQDPETGLYHEATHHPIHTTAHCMAALELFDAAPEHRAYALEKYREEAEMRAFLESLGWVDKPWSESHQGAGIVRGAESRRL